MNHLSLLQNLRVSEAKREEGGKQRGKHAGEELLQRAFGLLFVNDRAEENGENLKNGSLICCIGCVRKAEGERER